MWLLVPAAFTALLLSTAPSLSAQESASAPDSEARALMARMKSLPRGPFSRIRWFCADGAVLPPQERACAEHGGGVQHGELSPDALRLAELGYHVGTLFTTLGFAEFLDEAHNYDRLREIVVQSYLERVDDGWVYRRARFYRGSRQAEDEEAAGARLLAELLAEPDWVRRHFLLAMELVRGVPQGRARARVDRIRGLAKEIGDSLAEFQPIRIKIHSYPDSSDIAAVKRFIGSHPGLEPALSEKLEDLASVLEPYYREDPRQRLGDFAAIDPFRGELWRGRLSELLDTIAAGEARQTIGLLAALSARLRREVEASSDGRANLRRLELSLALQEILARQAGRAAGAMSRREAFDLARSLVTAAYGRGLLSARELQAQLNELESLATAPQTSAMAYRWATAYLQRTSRWAHATVEQSFGPVTDRYLRVEPAAQGFVDDLLRSTVMLPLAHLADGLSRDANGELGLTHTIFDQSEGGPIRGLNPGIARGILEMVSPAAPEQTRFRPNRIYILPRSFPSIPPVAGILTLAEGSSLSHLQLLARSLGIPNGVITPSALEAIRPYVGKEVLYVVSPLGAVILKEATRLSVEEQQLFADKQGTAFGRVRIEPSRLDLTVRGVMSVDELDPGEAHRMVGPKAAGVAMLRRAFPDRVAPGLVVPFGAFRAHLDRRAGPGLPSLYDQLVSFYRRVAEMDRAGRSETERDAYVEKRLAFFREAILSADLDPTLVASLREKLAEWGPAGSFGVFVRSDTNVEDLPQFSGAGLNLTVPNQVRFEDILDAIKRVWASPFTMRAYAWRQSVLETPEQMYVSVLIQRSVPVDRSGVLITADLEMGRPEYVTVSASEGFGGVVGGESAESLLVPMEGEPVLLAQAKAPLKRLLRPDGESGIELVPASGSERVLSEEDVAQLLALTRELERLFEPARNLRGEPLPWDVEFGFRCGELQLFQIRPLASDSGTAFLAGLAELDRPVRERGGRPVDLAKPLAMGP